jgi:hypothetical protein
LAKFYICLIDVVLKDSTSIFPFAAGNNLRQDKPAVYPCVSAFGGYSLRIRQNYALVFPS